MAKETSGVGRRFLEKINLNPVGREDIGDRFCKQTAVVTAIVANNNRDFLAISKVLEQIVSQSLCGRTDYIDIHTIGAGSHDATETTGTEFQRTVESINKRRLSSASSSLSRPVSFRRRRAESQSTAVLLQCIAQ